MDQRKSNRPAFEKAIYSLALLAIVCVGVEAVELEVDANTPCPVPTFNLPCEVIYHVDGDTADIRIYINARIRFKESWSHEARTKNLVEKKLGLAAKEHLKVIAPIGSHGIVEIPLSGADDFGDILTMDRFVGRIWVNKQSVGLMQVEAGHAFHTKKALAADLVEHMNQAKGTASK